MLCIQESILLQNPHPLSICAPFNDEISLYWTVDRYSFQTDGLERWQWIKDITGSVPVGGFTVQAKITWRLIQYLASISILKLPQKASKPPLEDLMERNFKCLYILERKSYFKLGVLKDWWLFTMITLQEHMLTKKSC